MNLDDFGPDENSPDGYIARVEAQGGITEWRPRPETIQIQLDKVGDLEGDLRAPAVHEHLSVRYATSCGSACRSLAAARISVRQRF